MAKKKAPVSNPITPFTKISTSLDLVSKNAYMLFPSADQWRQRICLTLVEWSKNPQALDLQQFCMFHDVTRETLNTWVDKYEDMQESFEHAKRNIACHRNVGAVTGKLTGHAYRDIHRYSKVWEENNAYTADLAKKTEESKQHITVIMPKPEVMGKE
jgi:hypothetical protein